MSGYVWRNGECSHGGAIYDPGEEAVQTVPCSSCVATAGERCRENGRYAQWPHARRYIDHHDATCAGLRRARQTTAVAEATDETTEGRG